MKKNTKIFNKFQISIFLVFIPIIWIASNIIESADNFAGYINKKDADKPTLIMIKNSQKDFGPFLGYNMQIITMNYGYDNSELLEAVKELKPAYIRFPGGTAGNFYHWKTDGFNEDELLIKGHGFGGKRTIKDKNGQEKVVNLMFRTFIANKDIHPDGKLGFDKFLKFCKEVGTEPIIHFNIYTENSSEPAEFVKYMKKLDIISVKYGMLGCENYAPNQNIVRFSNGAEEFLSAAENAYHKIKAVDPDIKLGVNLSPYGVQEIQARKVGWLKFLFEKEEKKGDKSWNNQLYRKKDVFDAYEHHYYTHTGLSSNKGIIEELPKEELEMTFYDQWRYVLFAQHESFEKELNDCQQFFPKPFWHDEGGI